MNSRADLLIVTAAKVESAAVIRALEGFTKRTNEAEAIGERTYRNFGVVNGRKILMVQTEPGSVGVGAALSTVSKGIKDLSPSAVIMVGIAFGFSSEKQRIGDILVSKQVRPYEQQRIGTKDGKPHIISRGPRPDASANLLNYFRTAEHNWRGQSVRFGVVVSGEHLVDNLEFRQSLLEIEPEAIGGEMESPGLYAACQEAGVDWILVKAICDWADGNKAEDKEPRQKLAAENAVAFLVHALRHARLPVRRKSLSFWPVVWVGLTVLFIVVLALTVFRRQFETLHGDTQQINRKVDAVYDKITSPPAVGLPWMEIRTQAGLSGPTQGGEITGEMVQTYRQHSLLMRNTNRFDLRNFSARLQLPENVLS